MIYVLPSLLAWLVQILHTDVLSPLLEISVDVTDASLGMMVCSRLFDSVGKLSLQCYFKSKYGHPRELYKPLSDQEVLRIHNQIAAQPHACVKSTTEIQAELTSQNCSNPQECQDIIGMFLAGTQGLLQGIRQQILDHKGHIDGGANARIDTDWKFIRKGRIEDLCLLGDSSYVRNIFMERFGLPVLSGRRIAGDRNAVQLCELQPPKKTSTVLAIEIEKGEEEKVAAVDKPISSLEVIVAELPKACAHDDSHAATTTRAQEFSTPLMARQPKPIAKLVRSQRLLRLFPESEPPSEEAHPPAQPAVSM